MSFSAFQQISRPVRIGSLFLKNRVFLAPLAGVSDAPFRRICQEMGAGLTFVEMLSATAINYENKQTFAMMARHPTERNVGIQVTGATPESLAKAVSVLSTKQFAIVDINMGCPVAKVVNAGCGSALLKHPDHIFAMLKAARQAAPDTPLSVKVRLGWTRETVNIHENIAAALEAGVDMITVHGRTRSENYATPVDRETLAQAIEQGRRRAHSLQKPIIFVGNGDIFDSESADAMVTATQCDALMISRGALGDPWIFRRLTQPTSQHPTIISWKETVLRHLAYHATHYGDSAKTAITFRKHLLWYTKGFPGAKEMRHSMTSCSSLHEMHLLVQTFAARLPADTVRFSNPQSLNSAQYDPKFDMDRQLDRGVWNAE